MAFQSKDKKEMRRIQRGDLKAELRRAKEAFRRKLEAKLQQNNTRDVWTGTRGNNWLQRKRHTAS